MKILNVAGARPNFMKIAPIIQAMNRYPEHFQQKLVHTGQHYDAAMSQTFFRDLGLPEPDINLEVGSASHAQQTARIMVAFETVCLQEEPDLVIVVGDVNSTLACTLTAKKLGIKVAHVEAGLRSRDMSMPEEINRLCTDAVSDYLFVTDRLAHENLSQEGIPDEKIFFVGNVMIDTLRKHLDLSADLDLLPQLGLAPQGYATLTLHRPSNVDNRNTLTGILTVLREISRELPIVFPIHPRTRQRISDFGLDGFLAKDPAGPSIIALDPLGYLEFLHLNRSARLILTDSGGLQEEATVLGIPCITLRDNTERPITCEIGTNQLVGSAPEKILAAVRAVLDGVPTKSQIPEKWDGFAADRIVEQLLKLEDPAAKEICRQAATAG